MAEHLADGVVNLAMRALVGDRKSLPSLLMASRDLTKVVNDRFRPFLVSKAVAADREA